MGCGMVYLVCLCVSFLLLVYLFSYERVIDVDSACFIIAVIVGNAGYVALAYSKNLEEAILANKISYVIGIFVPMIIFFIVCNVCRVHIPAALRLVMYLIQIAIFLSMCTVGTSDVFYKTVEFHLNDGVGYLTKTYGPMHAAYLFTLYLYTFLGIVVGIKALTKRTVVSHINVDMVLGADALVVGTYVVERLVHLNFDIVPVVYTLSAVIAIIPVIKTYNYSIRHNPALSEDMISENASMVFNSRLQFMGCNEKAYELFPELLSWELEVAIPGNGGRFNTFLRQPLLSYCDNKNSFTPVEKSFEYKNSKYRYKILTFCSNHNRYKGYIIRVMDVTDIVQGN